MAEIHDHLVVSGDSQIGAAIRKRLDCAATTRRLPLKGEESRVPRPETSDDMIYFDLRSTAFLPPARTTYFCSGINGFMKCAADPNEAFEINVVGTVRAACEPVRRGYRVVLLSSCAAETHPDTIYGGFKFLTEQRFLNEFGEHASVFRFGPVKFEGRVCYPNGPYHPLTVDDVVDAVTAPFVPGLHRIFNANRWEDVA